MKKLFLLPMLALVFGSCETDPYHYGATDFIELKKEPCFGFCPVYTVKIDGKGNATFTGERNVPKEGEWSQVVSPEKANAFFKAFEDANFWAFKDEYTAQVTDLPTTWITFNLGAKQKTIKDYYGAPAELKDLEQLVEAFAEGDEGWVKK